MTIAEIIVTMMTLVICGLGLGWMVYDMHKTIRRLEETEAERCESMDDEE